MEQTAIVHEEDKHKGFGRALVLTAALSVPLMLLPILGPVIASWAGCRGAGRKAVPASALVAAAWGGLLWWISGQSANVGGTSVALGPLVLIMPVILGGLLAGGLFAAGDKRAVLTGMVALIAGIGWSAYQFGPVVTLVREFGAGAPQQATGQAAGCPENLKRLYTAARLYADSWDEMLPPADVWMDRLAEYVQDDSVMRCPAVASGSGEAYGYSMNKDAGARALWQITVPENVAAFYDSSSVGRNAHDAYSSLPVPGRHDGSNNVVYLDGRVKAVRAP